MNRLEILENVRACDGYEVTVEDYLNDVLDYYREEFAKISEALGGIDVMAVSPSTMHAIVTAEQMAHFSRCELL